MNTDSRLIAFSRLLQIMDELREKCPWDQKQTNETLRQLTIEETYELSDAILKNESNSIKEELGDVLLHIVFYAKIGSEKNEFDITSIINSLCDKLVFRHPHIYGDTSDDKDLLKVNSEEDVKKNWETLKLKEGRKSILGGVPRSLPSMNKAYRIQEKAKQVGFEWETKEEVWTKVEEEINELKEAIHTSTNIEEEIGDVLFSLVNYARFTNIDPDAALEKCNNKFITRFNFIEEKAKQNNLNIAEMSLDEMDKYWNEAKLYERKN
jgi:XTP/dITP diphosphohydrolase